MKQRQNIIISGYLTNWSILHFLTGSPADLRAYWLHWPWTRKWVSSLNNTFLQGSPVQSLFLKTNWYCFFFLAAVRCFFTGLPAIRLTSMRCHHTVLELIDTPTASKSFFRASLVFLASFLLYTINKSSSLGVDFLLRHLPVFMGDSDPVLDPCLTILDTET